MRISRSYSLHDFCSRLKIDDFAWLGVTISISLDLKSKLLQPERIAKYSVVKISNLTNLNFSFYGFFFSNNFVVFVLITIRNGIYLLVSALKK